MTSDSADPVARLNQRLDALQAANRGTRWTLLAIAAALVTLILLFGYGLYRSTTTNLAAEKLQPVLMERVDFYTPQLQRKATEAVSLAMPTYQQLGREKLEALTPELRSRLQAEFETLPEAIRTRLEGRLTDLQVNIETRITQEVKDRFGELPPEKLQTLADRFGDRVLAAGGTLQNDLEDKYSQQRSRLESVLAKFDAEPVQGLSDGELQLKVVENAALLVVYLTRNPDELPVLPDALGELMPAADGDVADAVNAALNNDVNSSEGSNR